MRAAVCSVSMVLIAGAFAVCSPSDAAAPSTGEAPAAPAVVAVAQVEAMREVSTVPVFPQSFRGNWDYEREGCDRDESTTAITISDKVIKGYEGQETLLEIHQVSADEIRVKLHLETGSGEDTYEQVMILSPVAGISMRIEAEDGESVRAYRCDPV